MRLGKLGVEALKRWGSRELAVLTRCRNRTQCSHSRQLLGAILLTRSRSISSA